MECGGGALYDIGCYMIQAARYGVWPGADASGGLIERDPEMKTDRLTSAMLDFRAGQAVFTCSTQLVPYQRVHFLGHEGADRDRDSVQRAARTGQCGSSSTDGDLFGGGTDRELFRSATNTRCREMRSRGRFWRDGSAGAARGGHRNMAVIEAVFRSGRAGSGWQHGRKRGASVLAARPLAASDMCAGSHFRRRCGGVHFVVGQCGNMPVEETSLS